MNDRKSFGFRIKAGRENKKLTLENAAELCDVAVITWKQYESGQRLPSISKLINICLVLQVKPEYLLGSELDELQENINEIEKLKLKIEQLHMNDIAVINATVTKMLEIRNDY